MGSVGGSAHEICDSHMAVMMSRIVRMMRPSDRSERDHGGNRNVRQDFGRPYGFGFTVRERLKVQSSR